MEPTRVTSTSQSLIDHIYVTDTNFVQEVKVPKIALSDHYPVCISWKKSGIIPKNGENNIIIYRDATNFNQTDFINNLNTCLLDIEQIDEVNEAVNTLTMSFRSTLDKHAVLKQKRVKINRIQPAWFNAHIKTVILARNKAKRKGNKEEFKLLRNRVVSMIKTAKSQHYRNAINSNKGNSKSLWKHMRELTGQKSVKTPNAITLNDTLCNDPQVISDEFNKYFTQVAEDILNSHQSLQKVEKYETPHALHDFIARKLPNNVHYDFPGVTEEEIYKALKSLDVTKAIGMDEMSAKYISLAAPVLARHLSRIINISYLNETFPDLWKHAKVFPIFKSGTKTELNNYRPISILTILSKIIDKHAHDTLYAFLCKYDLISPYQSGFRKHHSCETGLTSLMNKWHTYIDQNKIIGCVNIDLRKAFDLINHEILCKKLKLYGCSDMSIAWIKSYLMNRKQTVCLNKCFSPSLNIPHGVPQGSILGPLLFILYINDLPLCLQNTNIHMYADDTALYVIGSDVNEINYLLNNDLTNVSKWFDCNRLIINESKTNCMLICNKQRRTRLASDQLSVYIKHSMINNVSHHNVLGITIDHSLKFNVHVDNVCKRISRLRFLLGKINCYLTLEAKQTFYNSYILPIMDYCITVWGYACKSNIDKLFRYQKRIGRMLLNDYMCNSEEIFEKLGWLTVYERLDLITLKQVYKCLHDDNTPASLKSLFTFRNTLRQLPLRNTGLDLDIPKANTEFRRKSFDIAGISLWNSLPNNVRSQSSLCMFKKCVKEFIKSRRESF